jgi:hypothetical protein
MPPASDEDGIPRWTVSTEERRIVLYRLPIERLGSLHREDELHRRMAIEGASSARRRSTSTATPGISARSGSAS